MGSCVGGLVGEMAERNWYCTGHNGIFFPPEPIVVFLDGMEKSDLDDVNNECSIFNMKTL